ncbi:unnamed protein product [Spirodela intermedia]|uniref:Uncharacterized protein n=1 Tax=Spirodela intermedia TaxID=51605 RepID=A0A7I8IHL7_SPIIN|nr:unnamed protein product [Spirodela intermedia]CAA6656573.1 unnamed protein product [Spirodela intermedia]
MLRKCVFRACFWHRLHIFSSVCLLPKVERLK